MSLTEIITSIGAIAALLWSGVQQWQRFWDNRSFRERENQLRMMLIQKKAQAEERDTDRKTAKEEQQWLNEQQRKYASQLLKQLEGVAEDLNELRQEHIGCREENASLRVRLDLLSKENDEIKEALAELRVRLGGLGG